MAYNCPSGCPRINNWSNPEVSYQNTATGVESTSALSADNARSLNNTRVIAANWRVSNGTPPGLGSLDLVWRNARQGRNLVWIMQGTAQTSLSRLPDVPAPWKIVATVDFDGDGKTDLLWQNPETGKLVVMYLDGMAKKAMTHLTQIRVAPPWEVADAADFDQDGNMDLLWRNPENGRTVIMLLENGAKKESVELPPLSRAWRVVLAADIDGDGKPDLVWRNQNNGRTVFMLMDGTVKRENVELTQRPPAPWNVFAAGDFDGDGKTDLVWRQPERGRNVIMLLDGTSFRSNVELANVPAGSGWGIVGAGRFD